MILPWYAFNKANGNAICTVIISNKSGISNKSTLCYMYFFINYSNTIAYSVNLSGTPVLKQDTLIQVQNSWNHCFNSPGLMSQVSWTPRGAPLSDAGYPVSGNSPKNWAALSATWMRGGWLVPSTHPSPAQGLVWGFGRILTGRQHSIPLHSLVSFITWSGLWGLMQSAHTGPKTPTRVWMFSLAWCSDGKLEGAWWGFIDLLCVVGLWCCSGLADLPPDSEIQSRVWRPQSPPSTQSGKCITHKSATKVSFWMMTLFDHLST